MPEGVLKAVTPSNHQLLTTRVAFAASDSRHQQVLYFFWRTCRLAELQKSKLVNSGARQR